MAMPKSEVENRGSQDQTLRLKNRTPASKNWSLPPRDDREHRQLLHANLPQPTRNLEGHFFVPRQNCVSFYGFAPLVDRNATARHRISWPATAATTGGVRSRTPGTDATWQGSRHPAKPEHAPARRCERRHPGGCATTSHGCAMIRRRVATTRQMFTPILRRLSSLARLMLPRPHTADARRGVAVRCRFTFITSVGCPATPAKTQQREI